MSDYHIGHRTTQEEYRSDKIFVEGVEMGV